ncbi:hypothetical protein PIB30_018171 [Stylosanthes scabra]|uniref:Uncharacterized protein n=1 Tax=Stylosanthes scabra TaxID=79078 RepID=A0ABU6S8H1_9FABA|nr:hypothetical protein [Stylosanthes scabra]
MARRKSRVSIELGVQFGTTIYESSLGAPESIRQCLNFKIYVQNSLGVDSSSSGSIPKCNGLVFKCYLTLYENLYRELRSRGAGKANDSAYGNSGPSGIVSGKGGQRACPSRLS